MYTCECWCDCLNEIVDIRDTICIDCYEGFHEGDLNPDDIDFVDLGGEG